MPQVSYSKKKKKTAAKKNVVIQIPEGKTPEIYTAEHEKLLGDSDAVWELCVDGCDEYGQRVYDTHEGKSCHQCRQTTLGLRTNCYNCEAVTGQFCGDCLYMRYGENVTEVNQRSDWLCPVCRGICNCSRCRREKGWEPTGAIYRRAKSLGYKSVAHYLIHTQRGQAKKNVVIQIPEGKTPEIYTEEHVKLLGDSDAVWELCVDGCDEYGQRVYDTHEGKSCHQCRQRTLGLRTNCCNCEAVTGQFCGDCLYMRYGENITEVNARSDWLCPVCRGICNCSRCRREKGWEPTGAIYRRAKNLGYKSVAHYLIYTQRGQAKMEMAADEFLAIEYKKEGSSDALTQLCAEKKEKAEDNLKLESDEEFRGDNYEEEDEEEDQIQ